MEVDFEAPTAIIMETEPESYEVIKASFFDFVKQASPDSVVNRSSFVRFGESLNQLRLKSFVIGVGYEKMIPWIAEYCSDHTNPNVPQLAACFYLLILKELQGDEKKGENVLPGIAECVVCYSSIQSAYKCRRCESSVVCEECLEKLCDSSTSDCVLCRYEDIYTRPLNDDVIIPVQVEQKEEEGPIQKGFRLAKLKSEVLKLITEKMTFWSAFQTFNVICHASQYLEKIKKYDDNRLTTLFESNSKNIPSSMTAGRMVKKAMSDWLSKYVKEKSGSVEGLLQIYLQRKCNPLTGPFEMSLLDLMRKFHGKGVEHNLIYAIFGHRTGVEEQPEKFHSDSNNLQKFAEDWKIFARLCETMKDKNFNETINLLKGRGIAATIVWQKLFETMCSSGYLNRESDVTPLLDDVLVRLSPNQLLAAGGHLFKKSRSKTWYSYASKKYVELLVEAIKTKLPPAKWTKYWTAIKAMIPRLDSGAGTDTKLIQALKEKLERYAAKIFEGRKITGMNCLSVALENVNDIIGIGHSGLVKVKEVQQLLRKPIDEHFLDGDTQKIAIKYIRDENLLKTTIDEKMEDEEPLVIHERGSRKCVIVFLIDGTASMATGLRQCGSLCSELQTVFDKTNRAEFRVYAGFVVYRDSPEYSGSDVRKSVCEYMVPTRDLSTISELLTNIQPDGGADIPEDLIMGFEIFRTEIASLYENDDSVEEKILIVANDAPGHGQKKEFKHSDNVYNGFVGDKSYADYAEYCARNDWKVMHIYNDATIPHPFQGHGRSAETMGASDEQLERLCMQRVRVKSFNADEGQLNEIFDAMTDLRTRQSGQKVIGDSALSVGLTMLESFARQFSAHYERTAERPRVIVFHSLFWLERNEFIRRIESEYGDAFVIIINYDQTAIEDRRVVNVINGMPSESDVQKIMLALEEWKSVNP